MKKQSELFLQSINHEYSTWRRLIFLGATLTALAFMHSGLAQDLAAKAWKEDGSPSVIIFNVAQPLLLQSPKEIEDLTGALSQGAAQLLQTKAVQQMLQLRSGVDEIEFEGASSTQLGYHVVFDQYYRVGSQRLPVLWSRITVHTDFEGKATWISNNLAGQVGIDEGKMGRLIGARKAIELAAQAYRERGEVLPEEMPKETEVNLIIWRREAEESAQTQERATREGGWEKGYRDELVYNIAFTMPGAPDLVGKVVAVDAVSGRVLYFEDASMDFAGGAGPGPNQPPQVPPSGDPCAKIVPMIGFDCECWLNDGLGIDRYEQIREFSTTLDNNFLPEPYLTVSCNEFESYRPKKETIWIYKKDPTIPFYSNIPDTGGTIFDHGSLYSSQNNEFPASVAELGFWSERVLEYLRKRGYETRWVVDQDGKELPLQIHAKPDALNV